MMGIALLAIAQSVAGDTAAFGPGVVAANASELHLELRRPAYVTVLHVWPDELVLAYPFDPRQQLGTGPATHQFRFGTGTRRVPLHGQPVVYVSGPSAAARPTLEPGIDGIDKSCLMRTRAGEAARTGRDSTPRGSTLRDPEETCRSGSTTPPPERWLRTQAQPQPWRAPQVLVILSDVRPDLSALSEAAESRDGAGAALSPLVAKLLTAQPGVWAAYVWPLN